MKILKKDITSTMIIPKCPRGGFRRWEENVCLRLNRKVSQNEMFETENAFEAKGLTAT